MREIIVRQRRRLVRLVRLGTVVASAFWTYRKLRSSGEPSQHQRVSWLHEVCAGGLAAMDVQLFVNGTVPSYGLIVSNHLSYLDILVLSATVPCAFISKAEVQGWPLIGRFAQWAGTVFVQRQKKGDAAQKNIAVVQALDRGVPVVLFPEGKTTNGQHILRFHSTMLQPAIDAATTITPCAVAYEVDEGSVEREVVYWGDMTLLPHGLNLLGKRVVRARIHFGEPVPAAGDRKPLSRALHHRVVQLYSEIHPNPVTPPNQNDVPALHAQ